MDQLSDSTIKKVQKLYHTDPVARRFLDNLAQRMRDATATNVDLIARSLDVSRGEALSLAKSIERTGAAELLLGRRGGKTRLTWNYSCISIGKAASGESADLEAPENPITDDEEEASERAIQLISSKIPATNFTIKDAKRMLAQSLGVDETNIEILIKA